MRFLRRIPVDPMTKTTEWGLRSMQDDPIPTRGEGRAPSMSIPSRRALRLGIDIEGALPSPRVGIGSSCIDRSPHSVVFVIGSTGILRRKRIFFPPCASTPLKPTFLDQ